MKPATVLHISDEHYCPKYLEEVDRCMFVAQCHAEIFRPDLIVLSGDLFDHRLELHTEPVQMAFERVRQLADIAPLVNLQGTFSHDTPGSLDLLESMDAKHPIKVASRVCQIRLVDGALVVSEDWRFTDEPQGDILVSCLPTLNRANLIAAGEDSDQLTEHFANILSGWAASHTAAKAAGIPTILVSHGTVSGCKTEHGVTMAGLDHEYTTGMLFATKADAAMLGHIHKHQEWRKEGQTIAYPGSVGRLHFGEKDPKGCLLWTIEPGKADFEFIELPARELFEREFLGPPDVADILACAKEVNWTRPAHVRLRIHVDYEHRHAVDQDTIRSAFDKAATLQIDLRVNPIQRQRAQGISDEPDTAAMLARWAEYTQTDPDPIIARFRTLEGATDPETIAQGILNETDAA